MKHMRIKDNQNNLSTFRQKRILELEKEAFVQNKIAEAMKVSEVRYRRLFETAKDGILILDADTGEITDVNPFLIVLLGYSREEFLGKKLWEIGPFKDIEESITAFRELQNKEYIRYEHLPLESKDGRRLDVEFVSNVYLVDSKKVIQCNIRDITERKQVEEALRDSEEKYRLLFENMLDGFAYCKMLFEYNRPQDFICLNVNSAFEKLTGLKNVVGKKVTEIIPGIKEMHPELFEIYGRVALTGKPERVEMYFEPLGMWFSIAVYSMKKEFFIVVFDNITERKKMEEILQHQAYHDNLTDLPNRALFIDHISLELTHARRNQTKVAVLFCDLDRFKNINDSMGHTAGDELLKKVAGRLKTCMRESDSVARIGGDEFAMLLTDIVHIGDIPNVAEKIISAFSEPFTVHNKELYMTTSIGISVYPDDGQNAENLLKNADSAMYQAKERGRNNYQFYVPQE
jgi:diguanylate cyclase (GGDEF)-like protein/PAS domain S-box-containing protein